MFRTAALAQLAPPQPVTRQPFSTGQDDLDGHLGSALAGGQLVELSGGPSSGKATIAFGAVLSALGRGQAAAWIDATRSFWPLPALEAGVPLERLMVVRAADAAEAFRAALLLLAVPGAVGAVVLDLPPRLSVNDAQLLRLQRLARQGGTALLVLDERARSQASLGTPVAVRLHVRRERVTARDLRGRLAIEVLRHKSGPSGQLVSGEGHGPDRVRVRSTV